MDKIGVVIVHFKSESDTLECLDSFISKSEKNIVPILVANLASFDFITTLKNRFPNVFIIENNVNTGVAKGNNLGIKKALEFGCEYVMLLNNDTILPKDFVTEFLGSAKKLNFDIASPKIYFAKGQEYHKDRYQTEHLGKVIWYAGGIIDWKNIYASHRGVDVVDKGQFNTVMETDFATGCCMFLSKRLIESIGFINERYFLYFEDVDYSLRAKKEGYKVFYCPSVFLWHKNASSSGKPGSEIHQYYLTRNRLYFGMKYASLRTKKSLILQSMKFLFKKNTQSKAVSDYLLGRMGQKPA